MENFTQDQHDRYEQYRRSAINKNTVRKFINHTFGTNPSMNVAQVISGFSKVFVGEMVEKARQVQQSRGESGPLAPEHLREAYRMYTEEKGKVGVALPQRGKRLFFR
ncbi:glycoside hydrolase family 37 protein [Tulasnella calospora MUT 4182]|uniref:Transcription initiation factor TFIID subunit 11 n=1 Tax=Tulasnella calospora MUT 4182 TaxID=1051891 RepID=A0A0C3LNX5_9AGAM|nr:glycoside hydrolase family 37 protein [Tulasnella calospora MUT 4182]